VEITYIFGLTVRYAGFHKEKSGVEYYEGKGMDMEAEFQFTCQMRARIYFTCLSLCRGNSKSF
jgi:hypothetical protein